MWRRFMTRFEKLPEGSLGFGFSSIELATATTEKSAATVGGFFCFKKYTHQFTTIVDF